MGSKSSRQIGDSGETLTKNKIEELCEETGFSQEELKVWHTNFYRDCPDGKLTLKQFEQEYSKIMGKPTHKTLDYVKHMFNVYDQDKNQFIDFREFVMALSAASVVNRLRLVETLFHVFDLDNDEKITKAEIGKMLQTLVHVTEANRKRRHRHRHLLRSHNDKEEKSNKDFDLEKRVDDAFNELNGNNDDHITKDEFIDWYIRSGLLSDVESNEINVADTARIQQFEKKARKTKKQTFFTGKINDESSSAVRGGTYARHISCMSEHRQPVQLTEDDNDDEENKEIPEEKLPVLTQKDSDDSDSHSSKENERWQHLFNSVLGQIRAQRAQERLNGQKFSPTDSKNHFDTWKQRGEETLKNEYFRQKSTDQQIQLESLVDKDASQAVSPEIVRVRL